MVGLGCLKASTYRITMLTNIDLGIICSATGLWEYDLGYRWDWNQE